ncbi:MAG: prepilin-type N-terminal cleavage/methylation domain-containing protein [Gammaproteobacteria bacterium]|nr:prepilin-type N-terminal cleavage/methylation domain-containing protein [Gammaproteobacteria bacterium]
MQDQPSKSTRLPSSFTKIIATAGFTLIETMVALTVSLLIYSILMEIYVHTLKSYRLQIAYHQLQINAEQAVSILMSAIKKSGYIGCAKLTKNFPLANQASSTFNFENQLVLTPHSLTVSYMQHKTATLIHGVEGGKTLTIDHGISIKPRDILIISDCESANIFTVKNVSKFKFKQIIYLNTPLIYPFKAGAQISHLVKERYLLKKVSAPNQYQRKFALFRENLIHKRQHELVGGIDQIDFDPDLNLKTQLIQGVMIELTFSEFFKKKVKRYVAIDRVL